MRKLAFGYSTKCNVRCEHCVAVGDFPSSSKMDHDRAKELICEMVQAGVGGVSFSAGEPFLYFDDIADLIKLCRQNGIYTRIVTNSFWAKKPETALSLVEKLKEKGLSQLRLSYSRWHQKNICRDNVVNAARSCRKIGLDYFISFITDFSKQDEEYEQFLSSNKLKYFPEPVIYAGRAENFEPRRIQTDYQANCCNMNPYVTPEYDMYACCDAGSHFPKTNFFYLGNLKESSFNQLFTVNETNQLYNLIRTMGVTNIASYAGMKSRKIITYSKCTLCRELFNSPDTLKRLQDELPQLAAWNR